MDRRIFGVETEYGLAMRGRSSHVIARAMFDEFRLPYRSSNAFLINGARIYIDVGSHPEYATAECDTVLDLLAQDKVGERMFEEVAVAAERALTASAGGPPLYVFKNNSDAAENTFGCHENYLINRDVDYDRLTAGLLPFLVTRQICVGAGQLLQRFRGGPVYAFSQRARHLWQGVAGESTRSRPMINTRDEAHADKEQFRRLHLIVGDSNMSETTMLLKIVSTHLVLRLIESGTALDHLRLEDPVRAVRTVSTDLRGSAPVTMADGTSMTAVQIQREYLCLADTHARQTGLFAADAHVRRALELWDRTLTAVETGRHSLVAGEIDWAIKLRLIERYRAKHDLDFSSPRLAQVDFAYHDINRNRGLYYLMERRGDVDRVLTDAAVEQARTIPPQTTRAKLRGDVVRDSQDWLRGPQGIGRSVLVDWSVLKVTPANRPTSSVVCGDPLRAVDPRVDRLRDLMR